ncbi:hypothetical protein SMBr_34590 [Shewanella sp. M-Br]|nr:four helix bundle protein [Shewanella sp. SM21]RBP77375.1 four helix bundle protein [Shewanella putrefaciens]GCF91215.1 hypothetical protein SMBr_34590 [Shewanella sp. M-Br]
MYYAKGSLGELVTQLYIGIEVGYLAREPALLMVQEAKELAKILGAIIKQKQSKSKSKEGRHCVSLGRPSASRTLLRNY